MDPSFKWKMHASWPLRDELISVLFHKETHRFQLTARVTATKRHLLFTAPGINATKKKLACIFFSSSVVVPF